MHHVTKPSIDTSETTLYIKFPADEQSYYRVSYPFQFESFSFETLKCIAEQVNIFSTDLSLQFEKSMYIKNIEQIYNQNATSFNKKVIKTCGILIGYVFRPRNEYPYLRNEDEYSKSGNHFRIFDVSSSYITYVSHVAVVLFICYLFKFIADVFFIVNSFVCLFRSILNSSIQQQMRKIDVFSLEQLDQLLLNTTYENNYQDCLFIVHDKYLLISRIDFDETSENVLQQFVDNTPFIIIPMDNIITVRSTDIVCHYKNNCRQYISFPTYIYNINFNPAPWLHKRLMSLNGQYRHNCEENKGLHCEEEAEQRLLEHVIEEETQYQQHHRRNGISRVFSYSTPASPRFIARFRLGGYKIISNDMVDKKCSICLEDLKLHQFFAQWPCEAKHTFHYHCMLNALRAGNKCPLCRHPVEAAT
ncbi:unnamed protein product [Rotaria magnacalcarata]|uniref:RING-type domain-containing protein n=2 Tax=Rotaria magnacalcarata TaxID=392030 RepID=A0A816BPH3_9BILA|nr:unnamed protein product [Rotaria magnacalcarata]CAF2152492.1 unnamed protein product [Rotaria magnacalcarata]CAF4298795.1 unnamed protein product [Rotaria magnacalcarata]CAF4322933.1 unnamed protein product [Rotaria magnacalcarata]